MTARPPRRPPLTILSADPAGVEFRTDGPVTFVGETSLDAARFQCYRYGFAYLDRNAVDESDISALANAILDARARYALLDGCRRTGCENRTDRPDLLCAVCAEVAEDVSARIRSAS